MGLGRYLLFEYLEPWGHSLPITEACHVRSRQTGDAPFGPPFPRGQAETTLVASYF